MSEINNGGLDEYDAELFEQQQFGTAGVGWVNRPQYQQHLGHDQTHCMIHWALSQDLTDDVLLSLQ